MLNVKLCAAAEVANSSDSVMNVQMDSPCAQNERFAFCKSCEKTCPGVSEVECQSGCDSPGCYCDPEQGFVRDISGSCVPKGQCRNLSSQCRRNEVFTRCRTCEGRCGESGRSCPLICRESGCECPFRDGYLLDSGGNCIPREHCRATFGTKATTRRTTRQMTTRKTPPRSCSQITCPFGRRCQMVDALCVVSSCVRIPMCLPHFDA